MALIWQFEQPKSIALIPQAWTVHLYRSLLCFARVVCRASRRPCAMATNGAAAQPTFAPVLGALQAMQSNVSRDLKKQAHEYLDKFQKSPQAWPACFEMLQKRDLSAEAHLFAATTLKSKVR